MSGKNSKPYSKEKLANEINELGLTLEEASNAIYMNSRYLYNLFKKDSGTISIHVLRIIEERLGITYNDIKPEKPKPKEIIQPEQLVLGGGWIIRHWNATCIKP